MRTKAGVIAGAAVVVTLLVAGSKRAGAATPRKTKPPPPGTPPPTGGGGDLPPRPPAVVDKRPPAQLPPTERNHALQTEMLINLREVQQKAGSVRAAKGKEDRKLVAAAQGEWGLKPDGLAGPKTLFEAARRGPDGNIPLVMYWPKRATKKNVAAYKTSLAGLAAKIGSGPRYTALMKSAAREKGQAGVVGG